jgi:hypothetical protein
LRWLLSHADIRKGIIERETASAAGVQAPIMRSARGLTISVVEQGT